MGPVSPRAVKSETDVKSAKSVQVREEKQADKEEQRPSRQVYGSKLKDEKDEQQEEQRPSKQVYGAKLKEEKDEQQEQRPSKQVYGANSSKKHGKL